jgi:hypothetical protein
VSAQVAADLRAAAEVLRRDGWTQEYMHCDGKHCALGAVEVVVDPDLHDDDGWDDEQNRRFADAAKLLRRVTGESQIVDWNDAPGRTADEVIAALEAAAQAAEATA